MKKMAIILVAILAVVTMTTSVIAAVLTIGNDDSSRSITDTRADFVIIDTNHPALSAFSISTFKYYASTTLPFRFVLVDGANKVKWVSSQITPSAIGANTFIAPTPVPVLTGWNLGLYFASTGAIPFNYGGAPAWYTVGGYGVPTVGATLAYENSSGRTYSFVATNVLPVAVDIRPGGSPNSVNLTEKGLLPVAILGSATFDVISIDPATVEVGGVTLATRGSAKAPKLSFSLEDVNEDGYLDLIAFFSVPELVSSGLLSSTTTSLELTADTPGGSFIIGQDSVSIVPPQ